MINEIIQEESQFGEMIKDKFGNYVIQSTLAKAKEEQRSQLIDKIVKAAG